MAKDLQLKVLPEDSPALLGAALARVLPKAETTSRGLMMSILRVQMYNLDLAELAEFPNYQAEKQKEEIEQAKKTQVSPHAFSSCPRCTLHDHGNADGVVGRKRSKTRTG